MQKKIFNYLQQIKMDKTLLERVEFVDSLKQIEISEIRRKTQFVAKTFFSLLLVTSPIYLA